MAGIPAAAPARYAPAIWRALTLAHHRRLRAPSNKLDLRGRAGQPLEPGDARVGADHDAIGGQRKIDRDQAAIAVQRTHGERRPLPHLTLRDQLVARQDVAHAPAGEAGLLGEARQPPDDHGQVVVADVHHRRISRRRAPVIRMCGEAPSAPRFRRARRRCGCARFPRNRLPRGSRGRAPGERRNSAASRRRCAGWWRRPPAVCAGRRHHRRPCGARLSPRRPWPRRPAC